MEKQKKYQLTWRNGHWYEDDKLLRKKDYIYHADSHEGEIIITKNAKHRVRNAVLIAY